MSKYLLLCSLILSWSVAAKTPSELIADHRDSIFQIRIIDQASGNTYSIGSAFQISASGLMVTNFHVIADALHKPADYSIRYIDYLNQTGGLELLAVDVVNDLALVQRNGIEQPYLALAPAQPQQGESIFSMGNPLDLGMTVVPGIYNSLVANQFYDRILFSGAINPGMSGGPVLNAVGEVVGINVATSGNELGFLVPLDKLNRLLQTYNLQNQDAWKETGRLDYLRNTVQQQLQANEQLLMQTLLNRDWPLQQIGGNRVVGEIAPFVRCWGSSENSEQSYTQSITSTCQNSEYIYLSSQFTTGVVQYQFYWVDAKDLNSVQFYNNYEQMIGTMYAPNKANAEDVTNYSCQSDFVGQTKTTDKKYKSVFCTRAYRDYDNLFDVLLLVARIDQPLQGLVGHFSLTGVSPASSLAFTRKFMDTLQ